MSDEAPETCYRHPDRQSYIHCQRCGRTICPECQTPAAVGVHCPECVREARAETSRSTGGAAGRVLRAVRGVRSGGVPVVTYSLIAINIVAWVLELLTGGARGVIYQYGAYAPAYFPDEFWRMLTSAFLHSPSSVFHILFNMYSLYVIGPMLEATLGRARYLALYLIAAFGGSVAVLLIAPGVVVVGASGAIFGLLAAFFVVARRLGGNTTQILVLIVINLALGFLVPGIAWEAHVGGLVAGGLVALIFVMTRARSRRPMQIAGVAGVVAVLFAATAIGTSLL